MEECCKNCRFSHVFNKDDLVCRRYPPTVTQHISSNTTDYTSTETYSYEEVLWPDVDGDDWCGEFVAIKGK